MDSSLDLYPKLQFYGEELENFPVPYIPALGSAAGAGRNCPLTGIKTN